MVAYTVSSPTAKNGATTITFTVVRSGTSSELGAATTLSYSTDNVSAVAGTDYTATAGSLSFAANATEATVDVAILTQAYDNPTTRTFLLSVGNVANGTGSIVPNSNSGDPRYWLVVPSPDTSQTVSVPAIADIDAAVATANPDPKNPPLGNNISVQADYSQFSDPESTTVRQPFAYIRMGAAGTDLNEYERVILDSAEYQPYFVKEPKGGKATEASPLDALMVPRGLVRGPGESGGTSAGAAGNTHLDGLFLYSNKNHVLTVGGNSNTVIQGTEAKYVAGKSRNLIQSSYSLWSKYDVETNRRTANGTETIDGRAWSYTISNARKLSIGAAETVSIGLGRNVKISGAADISATTAMKYSMTNSLALSVKGLDFSASCDLSGAYKIDMMGLLKSSSLKNEFKQSAAKEIHLSVSSMGVSSSIKNLVKVVSAANMSIGSVATWPAWIEKFATNGEFYSSASPSNLKNSYSQPFGSNTRTVMEQTALSSAFALLVIALLNEQSQYVDSFISPSFKMDKTGITLSATALSKIEITPTEIVMTSPKISINSGLAGTNLVSAGGHSVNSVRDFSVNSATTSITSSTMDVVAKMKVMPSLSIEGYAQAFMFNVKQM